MGGRHSHATAEQVTAAMDLAGKAFLVTGVNTGLGFETMRVLTLRGATVLGAARSKQKAEEAFARVTHGKGKFTPLACELSDSASIRKCVEEVKDSGIVLNAIICNAGIMAVPELKKVSAAGIESQFFVNHVGHFILVTNLLDSLASNGRVVCVSSLLHVDAPKTDPFGNVDGAKGYQPWPAYGSAKLANILFARELNRRFLEAGSARRANALHPGVIPTDLVRNPMHGSQILMGAYSLLGKLGFFKSIPQGAATQVRLATDPKLEGVGGKYFADLEDATDTKASPLAKDDALAKQLWAQTEAIVQRL